MKAIIIILLLLVLSGCGFKNGNFHLYQPDNIVDSSEVIDLSDAVNHVCATFDTLVSSIQIIPLETKDSSVVSEIKQVVTTSDFIYILDRYKNGSVIIFRTDGSFVKRLPNGPAPHEIGCAERIYYEPNDSILYVYDVGSQKIANFSYKGDFINYDAISLFFIDFAVFDDTYVLVQPSFQSLTQKFSVSVVDSTDVNCWELGADYPKNLLYPYSQRIENGILIMKPRDNYIYCYDGHSVYKKYKIVTNAEFDYSKYDSYEIENYDLSSGNFYYTKGFTETKDYQLTPILHRLGAPIFAVRRKHNGFVWFENVYNSFFYTLTPMIDFGVHDYNSNCLNGVIMPEEFLYDKSEDAWDGSNPNNLISDEDMAKLKAVKPDDNPIIVLFKLKDDI